MVAQGVAVVGGAAFHRHQCFQRVLQFEAVVRAHLRTVMAEQLHHRTTPGFVQENESVAGTEHGGHAPNLARPDSDG